MSNKTTNTKGIINSTETGAALFQFMEKVNSTEMLNLFVKQGLLDQEDVSTGYSTCVTDMDDNAIAYILIKMVEQLGPNILKEMYVVEGQYEGLPHKWIMLSEVSNVIIDPTLAQFVENVPDIAIVDVDINGNYVWNEMTGMEFADGWLEDISGISLTPMYTAEDVETVDAIEARNTDKKYKYDIGLGSYSFDNPINGLELIMYVLEEMDMDLDSPEGMESMDPIDHQEKRTSYNAAIKHISNILDFGSPTMEGL